jgi:nucleotide-binding universal stress UspA family protein
METIKAFQHILVPIDFGKASDHALTIAMQLGQVLQARLTLLHVVQTPLMTGPDMGIGIAQYFDDVQLQARQSLAQYAQRVQASGLSCEAITELASPFQHIVDYAATQQVDLIVMGTHGHTGLQHMLLGSVAERVVRLASCPVLVTRGPQEEAGPDAVKG